MRGFLESLHWIPKERGLTGVKLVVCDAHVGLTKAIRRMFQGCLPGVNYVSGRVESQFLLPVI